MNTAAQTQDFLNGQFSAQIAAITERIGKVEFKLDWLLTVMLGTLLTQFIQLLVQAKGRKPDVQTKGQRIIHQ